MDRVRTLHSSAFDDHVGTLKTPSCEDAGESVSTQRQNNLDRSPTYFRPIASRRKAASAESNDSIKGNSEDIDDQDKQTLSWKRRVKHVTWAWFTMTMATGGIANVLHTVPYRFPGLYTIGVIFFLFNILLYLAIWVLILLRFYWYPYTFKASFTHPTESLFVPAFVVSLGTILINVVEYGSGHVGEWLTTTTYVLFWMNLTLSLGLSILIYLTLWSTQTFTIARMTPIWIFPAYPLLLCGPHAANLSSHLRPTHAIRVIVAGFTVQGIGFLVSLTIYSAFVYRLMTQKLPAEPTRPAMFVSVGPSAFTVSGSIGMAAGLPKILVGLTAKGGTYMALQPDLAANILGLLANWSSLWIWGLAWYFFLISLLSNVVCFRPHHPMPFSMAWFSFIFPQTALTTATFRIGDAFGVKAINVLGCVMAAALVVVWLGVVGRMALGIVRKEVLWPGKGEDRPEGGFKARGDMGMQASEGEVSPVGSRREEV